jgi:sugar phosphate isomerase/epimerase
MDDSPTLSLGYTVGLGLEFERSVAFAAREGFDFVEILLDGPYARHRIDPRADAMRDTLDEYGVDAVVHLPFAAAVGSPFEPVREGVVREFIAGMDLAGDLGAHRVVFHPDSDAWDLGWTEAETREFVHAGLDELVPAARDCGLVPCVENVVNGYYDVRGFPDLLERYPEMAMTFDTSHALLAGMAEAEMAAFCEEWADRIAHLHLVDTRSGDEHLPVGMGRIDFETVLEGLSGWTGTATLEIGTEDYDTIALGRRHVEELVE